MNHKSYNKRKADNYFTKATGVKAIQLSGSKHCLVVAQSTIRLSKSGPQLKLPVAAYHLSKDVAIEDIKSVTQSCGVDQCVHPDHLIAEFHTKPSIDDIVNNGWVTGTDV